MTEPAAKRSPLWAWLGRMWRWLRDPDWQYLWLGLLVSVVAIAFALLAPCWTLGVRLQWAGWGLELLGLGVVAVQLSVAFAPFEGPNSTKAACRAFGAALAGYWARRPKRSFFVAVSAAGMSMGAGRAKGHVLMGSNASAELSIDERVQELESKVAAFAAWREEFEAALQAHGDKAAKLEGDLAETRDKLANTVKEAATGAVPMQLMGWLWLVLGTLLSGVALALSP
jgi:uncharacterized coiled-coil protein SlyX